MKPHLIAALLFVSAGCATNRPSPMLPPAPPQESVKTNFHRVELEPEWKKFVLDNYQDAVRTALVAPEAAKFPAIPSTVTQSQDDTAGRVSLIAGGMVYTMDRTGMMVRSKYLIFWDRSVGDAEVTSPGGGGKAYVYPAPREDNFNDLSY